MSKSLALAREELIRILMILENVEAMKIEPFSVNLASILERLRNILEEHKDTETILLDAETMYKISVVLGLQQRWIRDRASSLFIDNQLIKTRIVFGSVDSLAKAFLSAWRPLIRIEQITLQYLLRGYEHFLSLPARNRRKINAYGAMTEVPSEGWKFYREEEVTKKIEAIKEELARDGGWVDYWEFVRRGGLEDTYERAYLLSHLISRGFVEVAIDVLNDKVMLRSSESANDMDRNVSFVTSIRGMDDVGGAR